LGEIGYITSAMARARLERSCKADTPLSPRPDGGRFEISEPDAQIPTASSPVSQSVMRIHRSSQLIMLATVGSFNVLVSLAGVLAYQLAPRATAFLGVSILGLLWSLWLSSLWNWFRGAELIPHLPRRDE
jgi:hypothetical protein